MDGGKHPFKTKLSLDTRLPTRFSTVYYSSEEKINSDK